MLKEDVKKSIISELIKDVEAVLNYLENNNNKELKRELEQLKITVENLKRLNINPPKELTDRIEQLENQLKNSELNDSQKLILKYLKSKGLIQTKNTGGNKKKNITVVTDNGKYEFTSYRQAYEELFKEPYNYTDTPKRTFLRKVKKLDYIKAVYENGQLIYSKN